MESLILSPKIVMGKFPVPVGKVYHAVEGTEVEFYLITDGNRTPYRLKFRDLVISITKHTLI
jgi:NADH-quinone oxidoreductase subunit D